MITLLGVAHISEESLREVEEKIRTLNPDVVAVELCESRYRGMINERKVPVLELIKNREFAMLLASIFLPYIQLKLGEEVGAKPGKEMRRAIELATEGNIPIALIDRDIGITMRRALSIMSLWEKLRVVKELATSMGASKKEIEDELARVKDDSGLEKVLQQLKRLSPGVYEVLVRERDAYMARQLLDLDKEFDNVLAVVGAGHRKGIMEYISHPERLPPIQKLKETPKKRLSLGKLLKFLLPAFIVAMFILAFHRGMAMKEPLGLWVLNHAVPTFIALLIARGSPTAVLAGTAASPLTSLNPFLAAGWFAGFAEMRSRKVSVEDVSDMFKADNPRQLMSNGAFRVLMVAALANIGSILGTIISIPTIIYPLIRSMTG
jgi:pheromone shutdown-related protein TraB